MWKCIFLLVCAFQFGGGDVIFFFPDGIVIVLNSILQYLVSLEILICRTDWNRMSCGLCKGSENICLFLMEIQETQKSESQKSLLTRRKTLKRKEPLRRGMDYMWPTLSRYFRRNSWLQLPFLMLDFFKALGSLIAWISACRATESTHALILPSEPPPH